MIKEKLEHVGVSNETPWGLSKYLELSKDKNLPRMLSVQNPYNLLNRTYEIGLAEMSIREQAGLLAYSPLACGYLSGKYRNKQLPKNSRMERDGDFWSRYNNQNAEKAIELYYEISKKHEFGFSTNVFKVFRNSAICNICHHWCYYNGAVENKHRKCKYKFK